MQAISIPLIPFFLSSWINRGVWGISCRVATSFVSIYFTSLADAIWRVGDEDERRKRREGTEVGMGGIRGSGNRGREGAG